MTEDSISGIVPLQAIRGSYYVSVLLHRSPLTS